MHKRAVVLSSLLFATTVAQAGPTGLFLMPIADILKHREIGITAGSLGYERRVSKGYDHYNSVTVGLFDKIEVGYDNDFRHTTSGNVKLQLHEGKGTALSVGVQYWSGKEAEAYAVGRYDGKGYRLHGGVLHSLGANRLMLGTDFPIGRDCTGSLEFVGGPGSQGWASIYYAIPQAPGLGVQLAVGASSDHAVGVQHSALLYYQFRL